MRKVLNREGRLSFKLLKKVGSIDPRAFINHFGSMPRAYGLVGYAPSAGTLKANEGFRKSQTLRAGLVGQLQELFPSRIRIVQTPVGSCRRGLEMDGHLSIAVRVCRPLRPNYHGSRWMLKCNPYEKGLVSLIVLTDKGFSVVAKLYVVPEVDSLMKRYKVLYEGHPLLNGGRRLASLSEFCDAVQQVQEGRQSRDNLLVVEDAVFNRRASVLYIGGREIRLSRIQAMIIDILLCRAGTVVPVRELSRAAININEWFIRAHISTLRRKFGPRLRKRIITVVGHGYMYQAKPLLG
jgi:hypothetical protein